MSAQAHQIAGKPTCPICTSRESMMVDHPSGRFLCDVCATLFNGDEIEWERMRTRRNRRREWEANKTLERERKQSAEADRMRRMVEDADRPHMSSVPDRWRTRADLE